MRTKRIAIAAAFLSLLISCTSTPPPEPEPVAPEAAPGPAARLDGGEWRVFEIAGAGVIADSEPTVAFAEGRVSGAGSCNRFMGNYVAGAEAGALRTEQMASTMMACPEPLMQQEDRYLQLLGQVRSYRIEGDVLTLIADNGESIRARR